MIPLLTLALSSLPPAAGLETQVPEDLSSLITTVAAVPAPATYGVPIEAADGPKKELLGCGARHHATECSKFGANVTRVHFFMWYCGAGHSEYYRMCENSYSHGPTTDGDIRAYHVRWDNVYVGHYHCKFESGVPLECDDSGTTARAPELRVFGPDTFWAVETWRH